MEVKYSSAARVVLTGRAVKSPDSLSTEPVTYEWTGLDVADAVQLSAAELSAKASTRTTNRVLVLRPGSLRPGSLYRFTLTASDGSLQGQNQVDVVVNEFAQSGTLAVRP